MSAALAIAAPFALVSLIWWLGHMALTQEAQ